MTILPMILKLKIKMHRANQTSRLSVLSYLKIIIALIFIFFSDIRSSISICIPRLFCLKQNTSCIKFGWSAKSYLKIMCSFVLHDFGLFYFFLRWQLPWFFCLKSGLKKNLKYFSGVTFIGGVNRSTRKKPQTCHWQTLLHTAQSNTFE